MVNTGRVTEKVEAQLEQLPDLLKYKCHIERANMGGGLILCHEGKTHSEIKDTNKYRDAICQELSIPRDELDKAIASAKRGDINRIPNEETPGATIIRLAKENAIEFFRDQYHTGYATIPIYDANVANDELLQKNNNPDGVYSVEDVGDSKNATLATFASQKKTAPLSSKVIKWWIAHLYHEKTKETASSEAIRSAILVLEAETQTQPVRVLYNRFAPNGDFAYWWDMGDDYGRAIHYDKNGWKIEENPPQIFRRYPHTMQLPEPEQCGNLALFLPYLSLADAGDKLLAIIAPITYLIPEVPHVATTITGRQGSGKSTLDLLYQSLIDPSASGLLTMPQRDDDLIQVIEHHYLSIFDNVGWLTRTQSDTLCRAITGSGNEKRELYTTDDAFIRQFIRCIGLNSITMPVERSDLVSRNLFFNWLPLTWNKRKTDAEMKADIQRDTPKLIGAMLDVLVKAIQIYPDVKPKMNARMADFVKWGIAITKAMGLTQEDFEGAYAANLNTQDEELIKSSLVADQVIIYMTQTKQPILEASAAEIKNDIEVWFNPLDAYGRPIGDLLTKKPGWPKTAKDFSIQLIDVSEALETFDFKVSRGERNSKGRTLRIEKLVRDPKDKETVGQRTFDTTKQVLDDDRLEKALKGELQ